MIKAISQDLGYGRVYTIVGTALEAVADDTGHVASVHLDAVKDMQVVSSDTGAIVNFTFSNSLLLSFEVGPTDLAAIAAIVKRADATAVIAPTIPVDAFANHPSLSEILGPVALGTGLLALASLPQNLVLLLCLEYGYTRIAAGDVGAYFAPSFVFATFTSLGFFALGFNRLYRWFKCWAEHSAMQCAGIANTSGLECRRFP